VIKQERESKKNEDQEEKLKVNDVNVALEKKED
jgi:hypothetical protein